MTLVLKAYGLTLLGVMAAQAAPGPNMAAVASVGLAQGRRGALGVVGGVATGMLVWASGMALGLGAVLAAYPISLIAMKIIGGGYLLWLGVRALRAAWLGDAVSIAAARNALSVMQAWRRGLFVILTNPKAALMWAAVATYLFGAGLSALEVFLFGPLAMVSAAIIYGTYALLFSSGVAVRGYSRFTRAIETVLGGTFGALGGTLFIDGVRGLRS
ncbi:MAG: LysE family translocator [Pseudomonadota bacterium]